MKVDKEKVAKVLKSKKAMKLLLVGTVALAICFYGMAMALNHFGITTGIDILKSWGNIFVMIAIGIYAYILLVMDEDLLSKKKAKTKKKSDIKTKTEIKEKNKPISKCPECNGNVEIRKYSNKFKMVCRDCGIEIKTYQSDEEFYGNI